MIKMEISPSASALLRALLDRAGVPRDRILLTEVHSTDWQSLTFVGEHHRIVLRIPGAGSGALAEQCARSGGSAYRRALDRHQAVPQRQLIRRTA
jgi:hypothetical protein